MCFHQPNENVGKYRITNVKTKTKKLKNEQFLASRRLLKLENWSKLTLRARNTQNPNNKNIRILNGEIQNEYFVLHESNAAFAFGWCSFSLFFFFFRSSLVLRFGLWNRARVAWSKLSKNSSLNIHTNSLAKRIYTRMFFHFVALFGYNRIKYAKNTLKRWTEMEFHNKIFLLLFLVCFLAVLQVINSEKKRLKPNQKVANRETNAQKIQRGTKTLELRTVSAIYEGRKVLKAIDEYTQILEIMKGKTNGERWRKYQQKVKRRKEIANGKNRSKWKHTAARWGSQMEAGMV